MGLQLGDTVPDFEADSTAGKIKFHQWLGNSWVILFSHPKDYTPVCTTELGETAKLKREFEKRGAKAIGLSVDTLQDHVGWKRDIEQTQNTTVEFPMIADPDMKIANLFGMIHPNASDRFTVRSVFIIDPNKKVRMTLNYPASAGRNFQEILRVLDSLQLTDKFKVATPVNWKPGDDVVISTSVSNEEAKKLFPEGWKEIKPYLRLAKQPRT
jgi:alkyl hydroperoxide reductase subunit AhpC